MVQTLRPTSPEVKGYGWPLERRAGYKAGEKRKRSSLVEFIIHLKTS